MLAANGRANVANKPDDRTPGANSWTIRNFPAEVRENAAAAAAAAGITMADWVLPLILAGLSGQKANGIIPPRKREKIDLPAIDLSGLAAAANAATAAIIAAGAKPSKALGQSISATANYYAKVARGLTPPEPGQGKKTPAPPQIEGRMVEVTSEAQRQLAIAASSTSRKKPVRVKADLSPDEKREALRGAWRLKAEGVEPLPEADEM